MGGGGMPGGGKRDDVGSVAVLKGVVAMVSVAERNAKLQALLNWWCGWRKEEEQGLGVERGH